MIVENTSVNNDFERRLSISSSITTVSSLVNLARQIKHQMTLTR
ncbi:hypothetical protein VCHENC01_3169 [Vibrio harveyi]|nr:hypothetical protein VCHENC01_3169 [Vibrio harveyi]